MLSIGTNLRSSRGIEVAACGRLGTGGIIGGDGSEPTSCVCIDRPGAGLLVRGRVGVRAGGVGLANGSPPPVGRAFYFVPFEEFLTGAALKEYDVDPASADDAVLEIVYSDEALITRLDSEGRPTSSTSQPSLV